MKKRIHISRVVCLAVCVGAFVAAGLIAGSWNAAAAAGTNYYVSPSGSDTGSGLSPGDPWRTIQKAVEAAQAGDTINLADGSYTQNVITKRNGSPGAPITIRGSRLAIVKGSDTGRMFEINHDYITFEGFSIDGFRGGSATDRNNYSDKLIYAVGISAGNGVTNVKINNMSIKNALGECIRFKYFATNNEISNNTISNCGVEDFVISPGSGKNGEGIYIGTAPEQLGNNPTSDRDQSNNNRVFNNTFNTQGNECVDVKEGSSGNIIECNRCTGQKDANSAGFDARGGGNTFRNNESKGNTGAGIRCGGYAARAENLNDSYGNNIHDNAAGGIKFMAQPQDLICGNTFTNNTGGNAVGDFGSQYSSAVTAVCPGGTVLTCGSATPTPTPTATPTATPTPGGTTIISENFSSSAANFTVVRGGTWGVSGGKYNLTSPATSGTGLQNWNVAVHNTSVTGNFTLTADASVTATSNDFNDFSIVFGFTSYTDYYYASFNESNDANTSGIFRISGTTQTQIADITSAITAGTTYNIKIERVGTNVKVFRNGTLAAQATVSTLGDGKVGFGSRNDTCQFDNLIVTTAGSPTPTPTPTATPTATPTPTPTATPTPTPGGAGYPNALRIVNVSTSSALTSAVATAIPGDHIVLANGNYAALKITSKNGTAANPIVIRAVNRLGAVFNSGQLEFATSSYVIIDGMDWTANSTTKFTSSNNCRIMRSKFHLAETSSLKWIILQGANSHHNRIDHNEFGPKSQLGNFITVDGSASQASQYDRIDSNYFHDITPRADNEKEAIRMGWSQISMSSAYTTLENNLFVNCDGDPEIVSVKSSDNTIRYNTFRTSQGALSLRHGNRNTVYGNFMFGGGRAGTGGIRVYGQDHKIYNNYLEGLTGSGFDAPLQLDGGDVDTSGALSGHWRVYRTVVAFNTFVNNTYGLEVGRNYNLAPVDCVIANNIVVGSTNELMREYKTPVRMVYQGNIMFPNGSATLGISKTSAEIRVVNPLLTTISGLQKLSSSSPAIDTSSGTYSYVTDDLDGQARSGTKDVGADEFSADAIVRRPLTTSDVGYNAP